jgi:hypothetical protein
MSRHSPWPFSISASSKACKQQAFSRAVHMAMAAAPSLREREGVARELGAGAAYVSTRRVRFLPQVAGVQNRDLPFAYTARSGVESQQDDAGIVAELVLVRVSSAAHPREQDADVQAPPHFLHVRPRHRLQAIWAVMFEGAGLCSCRMRMRLHNRPQGDWPLRHHGGSS